MIVMKFGGSSLATPESVRRCAAIVRERLERRPVVVASAHGRTTDLLLAAADRARAGAVETGPIEKLHRGLVDGLGIDPRLIEPLLDRLGAWLHGVSLIRELSPRTLDHLLSFGERLSSVIFAAALSSDGVPAVGLHAGDVGLTTDSNHGSASPLPGIEPEIARQLARVSRTPVVTGFIGRDGRGQTTTLGRSGSDYSAAIIGAAVGAEEVQIWKDVDGVMTADPSIEPDATGLPLLSFREAAELAWYGAEVLHPSTLLPAVRREIPVAVLNTRRPDDPGTRIVAGAVSSGRIAKSVVYKEDLCLISLARPDFQGPVPLLAALLAALSARGIGIHLAATSMASASVVTDRTPDDARLEGLAAELAALGEASVERGQAIVGVVGEELRGRTDVLGAVFSALGGTGIKPRLVSQSASELNLALLIGNDQIGPAVRALHRLLMGG